MLTLELYITKFGISSASLSCSGTQTIKAVEGCERQSGDWLHLSVSQTNNILGIFCNGRKVVEYGADCSERLERSFQGVYLDGLLLESYDVQYAPYKGMIVILLYSNVLMGRQTILFISRMTAIYFN